MTDRPISARLEAAMVVLLFLAGIVLRLAWLGDNPPGLFRDEWEKGYTALELWQTGRHGVLGPEGIHVSYPAPLFIEVFAGHDRTSATYQWLAAPFVGLFGLGPLTTRLPAALAGIACLLIGWSLGRRWLGVAGGLVVLAVLAVQPTHVLFSRWAQQGILSLAFFMAGALALVVAREREGQSGRLLALAGALLLAVAAWAYDPARLVIPLVLACWLPWERKGWKTLIPGALLFTALWIPLLVYTLTSGSARLQRVMVGEGNPVVQVLGNYLSHFDPRFWFISGDANPRHALPLAGWSGRITGLLALVGLCGIIPCLMRRQRPSQALVFGAATLLLAPVAAALTREGNPHALRSGLMIVGLVMLAGCGAAWLSTRWRPAAWVALWLVLVVDGGTTTAGLLRQQSADPKAWESGLLETLSDSLEAPGRVVLSSDVMYAPYAALFVERTNPRIYHEQGLAALRTQIAPSGEMNLREGDRMVSPPRPPVALEWLDHPVLQYRADGVHAWSREEGRMTRLD